MYLKNKGISIIEVLATVAILSVLSTVSVSVFSGLANSTSLNRDASIVASYMDKARAQAINSVNSLPHGVKLETQKISVFKNTSYSLANLEAYYDIPGKSKILSINLTGGVTSFYFNKLTGVPSAVGTVVMSLADGSETKTITIYGTGVIDVE